METLEEPEIPTSTSDWLRTCGGPRGPGWRSRCRNPCHHGGSEGGGASGDAKWEGYELQAA